MSVSQDVRGLILGIRIYKRPTKGLKPIYRPLGDSGNGIWVLIHG